MPLGECLGSLVDPYVAVAAPVTHFPVLRPRGQAFSCIDRRGLQARVGDRNLEFHRFASLLIRITRRRVKAGQGSSKGLAANHPATASFEIGRDPEARCARRSLRSHGLRSREHAGVLLIGTLLLEMRTLSKCAPDSKWLQKFATAALSLS